MKLRIRSVFVTTCLVSALMFLSSSPSFSSIKNVHPFYENIGSFPEPVEFYSQLEDGYLFISESGEIVYSFNTENISRKWVLRESFVNATRTPQPSGQKISEAMISRIHPDVRKTGKISAYTSLSLGEVYDGISVELVSRDGNVEKIFTVESGIDPKQIKVHVEGSKTKDISLNGEMVFVEEEYEISFTKPVAYQIIDDDYHFVDIEYTLINEDYGFEVGDYRLDLPLIIDPMIASTYLGGSNGDDEYEPAIILDASGNIIVTGYTHSHNFPTTAGVIDTDYSRTSSERFVSIFSPDLSTLLASTFIGGIGNELGMGICLDENGNILIAGYTQNLTGLPLAENGYQSETSGGLDAFILKLSPDLTTLLGSAVIGGSADEGFQWPRINIEVGSSGDVFVVGLTKSDDFPYTTGAMDTTYAGGIPPYFGGGDAFLAKFSSDLTELLAATYIGGSGDEWRVSMILDEDENIYITGDTCHGDYPVTTGAYDTSYNAYGPGFYDMFISKVSSDLSTLIASTFLGSLGGDDPLSIKLDSSGNVYIVGFTTYSNFPTTPNAYSSTLRGTQDIVIAKLSNDLSQLLASTYIGGNDLDNGEDLFINDDGTLYVSGYSNSYNFPIANGVDAYDYTNGGAKDVVVLKMDTDLTTLLASTYVGGNGDDRGQHLLVNNEGNVVVVGRTGSDNFPTTDGAFDEDFNGGSNDCFVFILDGDLSANPNGTTETENIPVEMNLLETYPNPFNSQMNVLYSVKLSGNVKLTIYDLNGRKVLDLLDSFIEPGNYSISTNMENMAAGTYFLQLRTSDETISKKVVFLK